MLALDYVNYARWLPVILANLKLLLKNKSLFQEFSKDNFTVKNLDRVFSNMGFDQAHEQNNKIVKAGGGRIVFLITKLLWSSQQSVELRFLTYFRKYSATTKKMT